MYVVSMQGSIKRKKKHVYYDIADYSLFRAHYFVHFLSPTTMKPTIDRILNFLLIIFCLHLGSIKRGVKQK